MSDRQVTAWGNAIEALRQLAIGAGSITGIGDYVYDIRERELKGWDGPRVTAWGHGASLALTALVEAGVACGRCGGHGSVGLGFPREKCADCRGTGLTPVDAS